MNELAQGTPKTRHEKIEKAKIIIKPNQTNIVTGLQRNKIRTVRTPEYTKTRVD